MGEENVSRALPKKIYKYNFKLQVVGCWGKAIDLSYDFPIK
jgi:hypothetical protein